MVFLCCKKKQLAMPPEMSLVQDFGITYQPECLEKLGSLCVRSWKNVIYILQHTLCFPTWLVIVWLMMSTCILDTSEFRGRRQESCSKILGCPWWSWVRTQLSLKYYKPNGVILLVRFTTLLYVVIGTRWGSRYNKKDSIVLVESVETPTLYRWF